MHAADGVPWVPTHSQSEHASEAQLLQAPASLHLRAIPSHAESGAPPKGGVSLSIVPYRERKKARE